MSARESLALRICAFDGTELPTPLPAEGFKAHPHSPSRPLRFVVPVVTGKVSGLALVFATGWLGSKIIFPQLMLQLLLEFCSAGFSRANCSPSQKLLMVSPVPTENPKTS